MSIFKKNTEKHTEKLPMTGKVKKGFRIYCTAIMGAARATIITIRPLFAISKQSTMYIIQE